MWTCMEVCLSVYTYNIPSSTINSSSDKDPLVAMRTPGTQILVLNISQRKNPELLKNVWFENCGLDHFFMLESKEVMK